MTSTRESTPFAVGSAQIHLRDVRLRADVTVDEIHLDAGDVNLTGTGGVGDSFTLRTGETKFHVVISEPHINTLIEVSIPADAPVRNLRIALFSGKIRITGNVVKSVLHLPFTLDAIPVIENGVRVRLDCQSAKLGSAMGVGIPTLVVELIEQYINNNPALPLDLTRLPLPVRLDEIRCEPGRLSVMGRAKLQWPPAALPPAIAPFSTRPTSGYLLPNRSLSNTDLPNTDLPDTAHPDISPPALPPTENETENEPAVQEATGPTVS
jgi:hypothetical protein